MFWVEGLLVTYQVAVHRNIAGDRFPDSGGGGDKMAAAARYARCRTIVAARNAAVKEINRQNKRLRVARPSAAVAGPAGARGSAIADAAAEAAAVVALPEAKARPSAYRVNLARESVTAQALLPLHASSRRACKRNGARTVVLRAADRLRCAEVAKFPLMSPE